MNKLPIKKNALTETEVPVIIVQKLTQPQRSTLEKPLESHLSNFLSDEVITRIFSLPHFLPQLLPINTMEIKMIIAIAIISTRND